jgi:hypothetical protein
MPNHTSTILRVTGDKAMVEKFKADVKGEELVDFNKLVPMPMELVGTQSPANIRSKDEIMRDRQKYEMLSESGKIDYCRNNFLDDGPYMFGMTTEESDELTVKYGGNNWHSWQTANWGVKWGAYEIGNWEDIDGGSEISYQTAWVPATEWLLKVSKMYPTLTFKHSFADEGGSFLGYEVIQNGEVIDSMDMEWDSEDGINLRKELGVYHDEVD